MAQNPNQQAGQLQRYPGLAWRETPALVPTKAADYANRVEVERGEHDAVIRFYRDKGTTTGTRVVEVTVPLAVLTIIAEDAA